MTLLASGSALVNVFAYMIEDAQPRTRHMSIPVKQTQQLMHIQKARGVPEVPPPGTEAQVLVMRELRTGSAAHAMRMQHWAQYARREVAGSTTLVRGPEGQY